MYGNKDFILNTIDYMLDDSNLMTIRSRELTLRLVDFNKIKAEAEDEADGGAFLPVAALPRDQLGAGEDDDAEEQGT